MNFGPANSFCRATRKARERRPDAVVASIRHRSRIDQRAAPSVYPFFPSIPCVRGRAMLFPFGVYLAVHLALFALWLRGRASGQREAVMFLYHAIPAGVVAVVALVRTALD